MGIAPGTRLGTYEIVAPLGAGGMGEVYRALDTTLQRDVAIKVLPAALASDVERLARFRREAVDRHPAGPTSPLVDAVTGGESTGRSDALGISRRRLESRDPSGGQRRPIARIPPGSAGVPPTAGRKMASPVPT